MRSLPGHAGHSEVIGDAGIDLGQKAVIEALRVNVVGGQVVIKLSRQFLLERHLKGAKVHGHGGRGVYALNVSAHADAVAAENAFIRIPHDGRGADINGLRFPRVPKSYAMDAHTVGQLLKMAFAVFDTGNTVTAVSCVCDKLFHRIPLLHIFPLLQKKNYRKSLQHYMHARLKFQFF